MIEKLAKIEEEYNEIEQKLMQPDVVNDMNVYQGMLKRRKQIESAVVLYRKYRDTLAQIEEAENVIAQESDAEMIELGRQELDEAKKKKLELEEELKVELIPKDPNDTKDCIVEIRAGAGGEEAALFAGELMRMYMRYVENSGFGVEIMSKSDADAGGIKEVIFRMHGGNGAYGVMKYESGVHRVQRIPATESQGRVHTSAASVAVLPEVEEVDVDIKPEDLRVDVFRASGNGGQSVNTTDSAVRLTYIPMNLVVSCQDEKSQLKNKLKAMKILRSRLYVMEEERLAKERGDERSLQIGTGDRSEKIRTYNFPQDRVTDHRIKASWSNLPGIMDGDLGDIIDRLAMEDQAKKLARVGD